MDHFMSLFIVNKKNFKLDLLKQEILCIMEGE